MSHKQLYTKTIHLNRATLAEMGVEVGFYPGQPEDPSVYFNQVLRLSTTYEPVHALFILPKNAEIVSMSATNKYFFLYGLEGVYSIIPVTFEPFITTMTAMMIGYTYNTVLSILIKGPAKGQIPDYDKLYSMPKASVTPEKLGIYPPNSSFSPEHIYNIDLVINYTLPD